MRGRVEELALKYPCTYCLALPGMYCRTVSGAVATGLHRVRTDPIVVSWQEGFWEGEDTEKMRHAPAISYARNNPYGNSTTGGSYQLDVTKGVSSL